MSNSSTPASPVKDENYNLIAFLAATLNNAWQMETYIADAEQAGDTELAEWFRKVQHNSLKAGEQGKQMLVARLGGSAPSAPSDAGQS
ncbi:hypothetical protein GCM10010910_29030 [Microbacterium nanhaiense]|uniref:Uncharacterized protein n=1 Tax=Microbacterium nanhaiense TaxID=1301026 RepID=A0ABQ2N5E8_9MICO|nr:hypothetical protein [Microbacterium nanhaiense]GGO67384.1 hypothetical protein GCM10010910_29030 [Microbacterium nanhaiense]